MRVPSCVLLIAALVVPTWTASAQTDSLAVRAQLEDQIATLRSRLDALPPDPAFDARWVPGRPQVGDGMSSSTNEGRLTTRASSLGQLLTMTWTLEFPFREDPISSSVRRGLIDGPDSLLHRSVAVQMVDPSLTRDTFGPALRTRLAEALELEEIRFEARPHVVYVLRVRDAARIPASNGEAWGMVSRDQTFSARDQTSADLAHSLGGALGHVVVDETGYDGRITVRLDFDADEVDFEKSVMPASAIDAVRAGLLEATGLELVPDVRPVEWMVVRARR